MLLAKDLCQIREPVEVITWVYRTNHGVPPSNSATEPMQVLHQMSAPFMSVHAARASACAISASIGADVSISSTVVHRAEIEFHEAA
ncbi:MAG TPA: hypothetical protein VKA59_05600, partial [Vicinamibacterales bacterium]|nr:hypothetical protein [Vicinamibacterales bacterium]